MARGNRSHERTAEERERDRAERERRRVEREGGHAEQPADLDPHATQEHAYVDIEPEQPAEPTLAQHEPAAHELPADEPAAPAAPAVVPGGVVGPEAGLDDREPDVELRSEELEHDAAHDELEDGIDELPPQDVGAEPTPAPQSARANLVVGQRIRDPSGSLGGGGGRRAAGRGALRGRGARARPAGAGGRRRLTRARGAALLALVAAVALVWFLLSLFQPFAGSGSGSVIVQIPKGSSSSRIGSILAHDGVVSSGFFFDVRALLEGKRSSLHSGRFALKHDMSYSAAIEALSKPPPKAIAVKVVIPEGYTRRQIADLVAQDALTGSYLAQTKHSSLLDAAHYGAPAGTSSLEGFLFPATYDLTAGSPVKRLVDEQLTAFRERFTTADRRRARALHVTPYQLLTVASMIEREAQTDHDRPLIAAVIYNRLREGIPLGIDATTYYAVELQKGIATYTGELTESQLKIDSPYNTRTHKGLPPTPISNPGEASIQAAAHPSQAHYLYYVAGADGCGEQAFSQTYAQFEKNVAAYQAAVKRNGGHPPKCKKK